MKSISAYFLLALFPALILSTRQGYEELEKQLKEVFLERSNILRQLSKTSKELQGIKVNLQSLKNDEASAKNDVQKLLEMGKKQKEEIKSLQEAFKKQLNEATEKAEKQQATINFLKTEMERKSKMIRDLQNENKSLKTKLLSGNKLCGIHAEESKKIQAQLKELRYGKKDLLFKAQQLTELEQKLAIAKEELEKASLDKESQLKALKETVQLCLSSVLVNQAPATNGIPSKSMAPVRSGSRISFPQTHSQPPKSFLTNRRIFHMESAKEQNQSAQDCGSQDVSKICTVNNNSSSSMNNKGTTSDPSIKNSHGSPNQKLKNQQTKL
ncbi:leucine zipper protein 2 [Microcaecilia unicolor]|uniref:Leucine zipper protein 2 n=1 Tax=Microcaecilia unicolor TaxID=1415580 RepID=A0A6P7XS41_9AMPH|nr:leucine zipper protein 2 [Microcaecilia unicolor]